MYLHEVHSMIQMYKCINFNHTILEFNDPKDKKFLTTSWEKEKMLVTSIFSFSHNIFYLFQNKFHFFESNSFLSSANAFNWDQSKILSLDKEL